MTTYLPRSAWTSSAASGAGLSGNTLVGVAIHYPGSGNVTFGVESQAKVAERLRGWRTWHVTGRGWSDIGYNFAIDQAGRVWMLRSTNWAGNRVGAHSASSSNPGANHHRVGVLFVLGNNEQPSPAMIEAFRDWRHRRFLAAWGSNKTDLRGHSQVPGAQTSCPGNPVRALIANGTLGARPSGSAPPPSSPPPPQGSWLDMATKNDVKDAVREVLNEANGEGGSLRVQTRWTHILLKRLYDRLYGAHPTLGDPNKRWHSLSFLRRTQYDASMVRGDTAALRSETAALRELLGELLERDPSNPLTRADLDEAIERGMRRVEVQVRVVDEIDPPEGDEAPPDPDDDA